MRLVEAVGDRRAARAALVPVGPVHEVVHEQLRTTSEEVGERGLPGFGVEAVVLLHRDPGERAPLRRERVAAAGELLLGGEQLEAGGAVLGRGAGRVGGGHAGSSGSGRMSGPGSVPVAARPSRPR